jgi:trehalose 6-phosphate synthase
LCASLSDVDREVAAAAPDGRIDSATKRRARFDTGGAAVEMLVVDADILARAYASISNETLWRLNHGLIDPASPPSYDATWRHDWTAYVAYNEKFADAVARRAAPGAKVLVQDYHLTLAPAMIRERRDDLRIAHFTHTPWATPEMFGLLPIDVAAEIVTGLLGADSVGFHSPRWAADFAHCATAAVDAAYDGSAVGYDGRNVPLRVHPLGVDPEPLLARASQPDVVDRDTEIAALVGDRVLIGRVDRTEPAKNVHRGLLAVAELLRRHPEYVGRVVHLVLAYPSRQDVAEYRDYTELCSRTADDINRELGTGGWQPIHLEVRDDYPRSLATMRRSRVMLINPVRDGMNLVAKESSLLADDQVLVLSTEAGAADELGVAAVLIDPFDVTATAEALHTALTMPDSERSARHRALAAISRSLPPRAWLQQQLDALDLT